MARQRSGGVGTAVAIVVAILALIFLGLGIAIFQLWNQATIIKPGGSDGGPYLSDGSRAGPGVACIVANEYFRDTSVSDDRDTLVKLRNLMGPAKFAAINLNIRDLLVTAKNKNINAIVPLGIWRGETSYNPRWLHKAFGAGNQDSGTVPGSQGWNSQLNSEKTGVLSRIEHAINGTGLYTPIKPPIQGPDLIFTRLFYRYTTAMKELYDANGHRWVVNATWYGQGQYAGLTDTPVRHRLSVMQALKPSQIKCDAGGASASGVVKP